MVTTKVVRLTPELAKEWKAKNINNFRKLNQSIVARYASEMASGNWQLNGEPIAFYDDDTLANGQHRIEAVIKSGATIETVVVNGIKKDVVIYDAGTNRSLSQYAKASNIMTNTSLLSAATFILNDGADNGVGKLEVLNYYRALEEHFGTAYTYACKSADDLSILRKSGCIAAIFCAIMLNTTSEDKLEAFCRIANSGMPFSFYNMEAPIVLRNMMVRHEMGANGRPLIRRCFNATYHAIERFDKQSKSKVRYNVDDDYYKTIIPKAKGVAELYMK